MNITIAQIAPKLSKSNLNRHISIIKKHSKESDLIIFPELSLNGYMMMDSTFEDSFELDELNELKELSRECDILVGLALREEHKVFNSSIYLSKSKVVNIHRKISLPNFGMFEEARYFFKGDAIESFQTQFGDSVAIICHDLWSSDILNRVANLNPNIVFVLANSPARGFEENLLIESQWDSLLKSLAILASTYVIFVNRVGFEDGVGFWGGSRVITPESKELDRGALFEESIFKTQIDINLIKREKFFLRG